MDNIIAILQARTSSTRLPNKVLKPILGKAMILHQIERIQRSKLIDKLVVATSDEKEDKEIIKLCKDNGISVFAGSLNNVLDRFYQCYQKYPAHHIVRLTADCPLADWQVIDKTIQYHLTGYYDYTATSLKYPDGLDVEIMKNEVLTNAWNNAKIPSEKEHVTHYINQRPAKFKIAKYDYEQDLSYLRWTVDEVADFILIEKIYQNLYVKKPSFLMEDILKLLTSYPELSKINQQFLRNEGLQKSLQQDKIFLNNELSKIQ